MAASPLANWSVQDVQKFLISKGKLKMAKSLLEEEISGADLIDLTDEELTSEFSFSQRQLKGFKKLVQAAEAEAKRMANAAKNAKNEDDEKVQPKEPNLGVKIAQSCKGVKLPADPRYLVKGTKVFIGDKQYIIRKDGAKSRDGYIEYAPRTSNGRLGRPSRMKFQDVPKKMTYELMEQETGKNAEKGVDIFFFPMKETLRSEKEKINVMESCLPRNFEVLDTGKVPEKVLLVMGATGVGKSTLINGMLNYILGIEYDDKVRFKLINEERTVDLSAVGDQTKSQTDYITIYRVQCYNDMKIKFHLTVIDTPGFGDCRGITRDQKTIKQIKHVFDNPKVYKVEHISFLSLVLKSTETRLDASAKYIFNQIFQLFGKEVEKAIFPCFTFHDGKEDILGRALLDADDIPVKNCATFQNSAIYDKTSFRKNVGKFYWEIGNESFVEFFPKLACQSSTCLDGSRSVMRERDRLQCLVTSLHMSVQQGLSQADHLREIYKDLKAYAAQVNDISRQNPKGFVRQKTVVDFREVKLPPGQHTTTCTNCNHTCHDDCAFGDDKDKERCCAITNGYCTVCPRKCHWQKHRNYPYKKQAFSRTETTTLHSLKAEFDGANKGKMDTQKVLDGLARKLLTIMNGVTKYIGDMHRCREKLAVIAYREDKMTCTDYIDTLILVEENEKQAGWLARKKTLEEMKLKAKMMESMQDPNYDPFASLRQELQSMRWADNSQSTGSQSTGLFGLGFFGL